MSWSESHRYNNPPGGGGGGGGGTRSEKWWGCAAGHWKLDPKRSREKWNLGPKRSNCVRIGSFNTTKDRFGVGGWEKIPQKDRARSCQSEKRGSKPRHICITHHIGSTPPPPPPPPPPTPPHPPPPTPHPHNHHHHHHHHHPHHHPRALTSVGNDPNFLAVVCRSLMNCRYSRWPTTIICGMTHSLSTITVWEHLLKKALIQWWQLPSMP